LLDKSGEVLVGQWSCGEGDDTSVVEDADGPYACKRSHVRLEICVLTDVIVVKWAGGVATVHGPRGVTMSGDVVVTEGDADFRAKGKLDSLKITSL
jgi:CO/xanthine dehydrogenase Mo-binding subunit